jgi:hypothetical protein
LLNVGDDGYAVGFKVGDAVVRGVAEHDGFAEHGEVPAGVIFEVAADGVVVVGDEGVSGFALGAVDGVFEPAVEGRRREWGDGIGSGFDGGDDHANGVLSWNVERDAWAVQFRVC